MAHQRRGWSSATFPDVQVLLVDAFGDSEDDRGVAALATELLEGRGHGVDLVQLEAEGFDRYMTAAERRAYHEPDNLLTEETRRSAALLTTADALVMCCPVVLGSVPPRLKSWFERVFVPEVSFTFTRSGKVTGNLERIGRVGMIVSCPDDDPIPHRRNSSTRSIARLPWLSGSRRSRIRYVPVCAGDDPRERIAQGLRSW